MNINLEYKVSLTQTELQRIIAAHCGFPLDSKIQITVEEEKQQTVENEWIDVPMLWPNEYCPTEYPDGTQIDVMFRDGEMRENTRLYDWGINWRQKNVPWNIEKYRVSKG